MDRRKFLLAAGALLAPTSLCFSGEQEAIKKITTSHQNMQVITIGNVKYYLVPRQLPRQYGWDDFVDTFDKMCDDPLKLHDLLMLTYAAEEISQLYKLLCPTSAADERLTGEKFGTYFPGSTLSMSIGSVNGYRISIDNIYELCRYRSRDRKVSRLFIKGTDWQILRPDGTVAAARQVPK